jgi:hypothetical protein
LATSAYSGKAEEKYDMTGGTGAGLSSKDKRDKSNVRIDNLQMLMMKSGLSPETLNSVMNNNGDMVA